ncbi:MAG: hypothetical protein Q8L89_03385 [Gammaproteobacteria bacterium]|nr:hypothetical protein [Gammaproteobacteria bacterium]
MSKTILIMIPMLALLASSCKTTSTASHQLTVTDTTQVDRSVRERDTLILIPSATALLNIALGDLTGLSRPWTVQSGHATISAVVLKDTLYMKAHCDSMTLELTMRDSIINTLRSRNSVSETVEIVREPFVPDFVKVLAWIGGIALLLLLIMLIVRMLRPY